MSDTPMPREMRESFIIFSRLGRWGSCANCPRSDGMAYPEFCEFTSRHDHQLGIDSLAEAFKNHKKAEDREREKQDRLGK